MTTPHYVTLTLYVDETVPPVHVSFAAEYLRRWWRPGDPAVHVPSWPAAYRVLRTLGLSAVEARHRINFARTGDMYATRTAGRRRQRQRAVHRS